MAVSLRSEPAPPFDRSPNELAATVVGQPEPATHGGGAICDPARCTSGAVTQPPSPSTREQARRDERGKDRIDGIGSLPTR
jgi:hypothetical protein